MSKKERSQLYPVKVFHAKVGKLIAVTQFIDFTKHNRPFVVLIALKNEISANIFLPIGAKNREFTSTCVNQLFRDCNEFLHV